MTHCCDNKNSGDKLTNINSNSTLDVANSSLPRKYRCPINRKIYNEVSPRTIIQHIESPWNFEWNNKIKDEKFYFCEDPECEVVYFSSNDAIFYKSQLRTVLGIKEKSQETFICYCFGISKALAAENPEIINFVIQQTKQKMCACDTRNPAGRCCLKDFP